MKKFTGLLAIIILLLFSLSGNPPDYPIDTYAGEFHSKNKKERIVNEKDIISDDDTTILIVSQQLRE